MQSTTFKAIPPVSVLNLLKSFGFDMSERAGGACLDFHTQVIQQDGELVMVDSAGQVVSCVSPELFAKTVLATESSLKVTLFR